MEGVDNKLQSLEQAMDTRLARIEDQNHQIMLALQKKKKGTFFVSFAFCNAQPNILCTISFATVLYG